MKISKTAEAVLKKRYLLKDSKGNVKETPEQMFRRAAREIAKADSRYGQDRKKAEKEFFDVMSSFDFLPNSPTLMNAGTELQQLSACFVLPVEDSMESIFSALRNMALIHQSGGGVQVEPLFDVDEGCEPCGGDAFWLGFAGPVDAAGASAGQRGEGGCDGVDVAGGSSQCAVALRAAGSLRGRRDSSSARGGGPGGDAAAERAKHRQRGRSQRPRGIDEEGPLEGRLRAV